MLILYLIIGFLAVSIVFYCLFGGADFGAGILDMAIQRKDGTGISDVIGPVWEANHVWLIVAVVILFMGFPKIYSTISLYLHVPLLLMLIGIILRGTAFTYMHYDAIQDRSTAVYRWIFNISSIVTPFFLGTVVGALMLGRIDADAGSFYTAFMAPWLNGFAFSMGLFCITLFAFLAAIFMIGEAETGSERRTFVKAAKVTQITTVGAGGLVFAASWLYELNLITLFVESWVAVVCIVLATMSLAGIWIALNREWVWISRLIAGAQVLFILVAWFWVQHPVVITMRSGADVTLLNSAAPDATLYQLLIALLIGSCFILPGLYFLYKTFKSDQKSVGQ